MMMSELRAGGPTQADRAGVDGRLGGTGLLKSLI